MRFLAVNGQPARFHQHLAVGAERVLLAVLLDGADARRDLIFGAREKHRHEAPHHKVVQLLFGFAQTARCLQCRDDGEVVRDLGVVEDALARLDVVAVDGLLRIRRQMLHAAGRQHLHRVFHHRQIVFRQRARIGSRVGQRLVPLVQALRDLQGGLGGKAEAAVGLALQRGQVEQLARGLRRRLAFFGHGGGLAARGISNLACAQSVPDAVGALFGVGLAVGVERRVGLFPVRVEPLARVLAGFGLEHAVDFPIVARDEFADFFFALDHH